MVMGVKARSMKCLLVRNFKLRARSNVISMAQCIIIHLLVVGAFLETRLGPSYQDLDISINLVNNGCLLTHPCVELIAIIRNFMGLNWCVMIKHCQQEANKVADRLANQAHMHHMLDESLMMYDNPFVCYVENFMSDMKGIHLPRTIAIQLLCFSFVYQNIHMFIYGQDV